MENLLFLVVCVLTLVVWNLNTRVARVEARNFYNYKNKNNRGVENGNK